MMFTNDQDTSRLVVPQGESSGVQTNHCS